MRSGVGKGTSGEVLLVGKAMLVVRLMGVVVCRLRSMMVGVILRLKLGHLHSKSLMGLTTIHQDMLSLMALAIHGERIQRG